MKSICLILSLFGFAWIQSCTSQCCQEPIPISKNDINPPIASMPTAYWFKEDNDSFLMNFGSYKKDYFFMKSTYEGSCGFFFTESFKTCDKMTKVKTYSLIDSNTNRVLQFHFYPFHYSPYSRNGNRVKLTVRLSNSNDDITVFDYLYDEDGYGAGPNHELEWGDINSEKVKSVEYSYEKGLKKLELHEGLVIYAAD
jgi:hypothetical protein